MPVYEYHCAEHGVFETLKPMSECSLPADCPGCGEPAPRILSAPRLRAMARSEVIARDRNEKSKHEPTVARSSCGHDHHHAPASPPSHKPRAYTGPRPWVIEHA